MRAWDMVMQQRDYALRMGVALFILALVVSFASAFTPIAKVPVAGYFGLLAMQCFGAHSLLCHIAKLQAQIDMMKIAKGEEPD